MKTKFKIWRRTVVWIGILVHPLHHQFLPLLLIFDVLSLEECLQISLPITPQAGHSNRWYDDRLNNELNNRGYSAEQYSMRANVAGNKTRAIAILDACRLQQQPQLTWMAIPGVMRRMHVCTWVIFLSFSPSSNFGFELAELFEDLSLSFHLKNETTDKRKAA